MNLELLRNIFITVSHSKVNVGFIPTSVSSIANRNIPIPENFVNHKFQERTLISSKLCWPEERSAEQSFPAS